MRRRAGLSSTTVRQGSRRRYRLIVTCCGYCAPPRGWTGCRARLVELGMALYGKHGAFGANAALSRRAEKSKKRALSRQCDCAGAGVRPYARRCTPKVLVCGCSGCSCGAAWLWLGCLLGWAGLSRVRSANFLGALRHASVGVGLSRPAAEDAECGGIASQSSDCNGLATKQISYADSL